jgi:acyl-CoA thioesterase YciA
MAEVMSFRKIVMPGHLNPAHRLFGGLMMSWLDEAGALYAVCQMKSTSLVTKKFSEVMFNTPVKNGDILEFMASTKAVGKTSLTVTIRVIKKFEQPEVAAVTCDIVFVKVDEQGNSIPHGIGS